MNTSTTFPRHDVTVYTVEEHNIVDAPPDLWPLIREWMQRRAAE